MRTQHTWWRTVSLLICGLVFVLSATGYAAATAVDAVWAAQSFQRLAALDLPAAQEVWMQSSTRQLWQQSSQQTLGDSLDAAAFFTHMLWLPAEGPRSTWLVGLLNLWIGELLVVQFDENLTTIEGFHLAATEFTAIDNSSSATLTESITQRLVSGASRFDQIVDSWPRRGAMEPDLVAWDTLGTRLEPYRDELRRLLSPDGFSVWGSARENYAAVLGILAESELPEAFVTASSLPLAWRQQVVPIWASEHADSLNVLVSADADPFTLLWMRLKTETSEIPADEIAVIDLFSLLAGVGGGQ